MEKFKKLTQTELQNTTGGAYPVIPVPVTMPFVISKWIINHLYKK